jgi:hypothetical protein
MTWRIRDEVLTENHKRSLNIAAFVRAGTARIGEEISEAERERQDRELEKKDPRVRDCIVSDANSGVKYGSGKIATCLTEEEMGVWESWEQTRQMTATSDWTVH